MFLISYMCKISGNQRDLQDNDWFKLVQDKTNRLLSLLIGAYTPYYSLSAVYLCSLEIS